MKKNKPASKKKTGQKKEVAKKTVAKKTVVEKTVAKKTVAKKTVAKKTVAKKSAAKKAVVEKTVVENTSSIKTAPEKSSPEKTVAESSTPVTYMIDTNILYRWAATFTSAFDRQDGWYRESTLRIKNFCEKNRNPVVVPDIVWVEFLSGMLHRDIDIDEDYRATLRKFRDKQALISQIEARIRSWDNWTLEWEPNASPFADARELLMDPDLIDPDAFDWLKNNARKRQKYHAGNDGLKAKILDGMDSAILICLNELASLKQNKNRTVVLYTADMPLWYIARRVRQIHKAWFAPNTGAIFALHDKVICRRKKGRNICLHRNDASILQREQMLCENPRPQKHLVVL